MIYVSTLRSQAKSRPEICACSFRFFTVFVSVWIVFYFVQYISSHTLFLSRPLSMSTLSPLPDYLLLLYLSTTRTNTSSYNTWFDLACIPPTIYTTNTTNIRIFYGSDLSTWWKCTSRNESCSTRCIVLYGGWESWRSLVRNDFQSHAV